MRGFCGRGGALEGAGLACFKEGEKVVQAWHGDGGSVADGKLRGRERRARACRTRERTAGTITGRLGKELGREEGKGRRREEGCGLFLIFFFLCFFYFSTEIFRKGKNKKIK